MGEKLAANPVTGTASFTVPIATSPGRAGFGPQLALSYDSAAGNGCFGLGWDVSVPSITRKTDKGLPRYDDTHESDVFILAGTEDLVPAMVESDGHWIREVLPSRHVQGAKYQVQRYRPRIEGLFAWIERWTNSTDPSDDFWRSISKDNVTSWFGRSSESRITDPAHPARVFSWLLCESHDATGNVIRYRYKAEDSSGVDTSQAHERHRTHASRSANRYLKRVCYGNRTPFLPVLAPDAPWPSLPEAADWLFEAVLDYGEHDPDAPSPDDTESEPTSQPWPVRPDPFSSSRSGFEVRTYRLCRRILMFHHIPDATSEDLHIEGYNGLVRSTEFHYSPGTTDDSARPLFSRLASVTQIAHQRRADGSYRRRSLPPLEFTYSEATVREELREVAPEELANLPVGLDGAEYRWIDLDGEGLPGILTEQAEGWFYKRNLSPISRNAHRHPQRAEARFAPLERLATQPAYALSSGAQFLDLAGDGQADVVTLRGPTPGFYERTHDGQWEPFRPFKSLPVLNWNDSNLHFVDLTGDNHADIFIIEEDRAVMHPALGENGFGPAEIAPPSFHEEGRARCLSADASQTIHFADMSGDGLADLVRIRNGEICYWPNLGYGRFGPKVTMDQAPWLDSPDCFDARRIQLADIDGSGLTDLIYLGADRIQLYFNRSGNAWSPVRTLSQFPRTDSQSAVAVIDLLGNGTACLVWSSPLAGESHRPMRFIDLLDGQKPHLLIGIKNNLGAKTSIEYAPSTRFYLEDKLAGRPWITRLPFPVHCVARVTVTDQWRRTSFSTTYSYHHGYFDPTEREFRGFGRVEQVDIEDYDTFAAANARSPFVTSDQRLFQPPVKTVTWFHTGACLDRERILGQFSDEYFSRQFALPRADGRRPSSFREKPLPEPDLNAEKLTTVEWEEALRACKGQQLRQEVYELDLESARRGEHRPVRLLSASDHTCHIRRLQPRSENRHAVFLVTEAESIAYEYELDLRPVASLPDPRITHTLNLKTDDVGNVLQSVTVVYGRLGRPEDPDLEEDQRELIRSVQEEMHVAYSETRYTHDVLPAKSANPHHPDALVASDAYRLRLPCEVLTYELSGLRLAAASPSSTGSPPYFSLGELRQFRLSDVHPTEGIPVVEIPYHQHPAPTVLDRPNPQKRCVEHARTLFFQDDPGHTDFLSGPRPLSQLGPLGLPYESYKLALTNDLLNAVFGGKLTPEVLTTLGNPAISGYLTGPQLEARFPGQATEGQFWVGSGVAGFNSDAPSHFFLPERYIDPFDQVTTLEYDPLDLFVKTSSDSLGNETSVIRFDARVLAPREIRDINRNLSEVVFDVLGLPAAVALKGKGGEGDNLDDLSDGLVNPEPDELRSFFEAADFPEAVARLWLGNATIRHVYGFGESIHPDGSVTWGSAPACACGLARERHLSQLRPGESSPFQAAFEYSDGSGNVLVAKVQAEAERLGGPLRWIANGRTVLNNKGKPVKQYEPYFSESGHRFEEPREAGVTPVLIYDAAGRLVRTDSPDGTFTRVEFSPWHVTTFDPNDTVLESAWFAERGSPDPRHRLPSDATPDTRAAWLAAQHANTPAVTVFDSLGREVISMAHHRRRDDSGVFEDEKRFLTHTRLDAEGKPLWIRDARRNLVMQYITPPVPNNQPADPTGGFVPCYDLAGNLLFQHSMDAGDRWMLTDAAGQSLISWDFNERQTDGGPVEEHRVYLTEYNALRRPVAHRLRINGGPPLLIEHHVYGEPEVREPVALRLAQDRNLLGQVRQHFDSSSRVENVAFDFKGNLLEVRRRLTSEFREPIIDWSPGSPTARLEPEEFHKITEYDALNRMTRLFNWHRGDGTRVAVYLPTYNPRGLLHSEDLIIGATKTRDGFEEQRPPDDSAPGQPRRPATRIPAIREVSYNEKGQRTRLLLGNGTVTRHHYDPLTFRLTQIRTTRPSADPEFPRYRANLADPDVLQQLLYTYDATGNIVQIDDEAYKPVFFNQGIAEPRNLYEYDSLNRLIFATGRETAQGGDAAETGLEPEMAHSFPVTDQTLRHYTQIYSYDEVGNILRMRHFAGVGISEERWTRRYSYAPDSNHLHRTWTGHDDWDNPDARHKVEYRHDTHGNMLNLNRVSEEFRLRWDHCDMIRSINLGGGGFAYYNYDATKQRTRKVITDANGARQSERQYLGALEVYHSLDANAAVIDQVDAHHLFADDQRAMIVEDVLQTSQPHSTGETLHRYQYSNFLGSVTIELDSKGAVSSCEEYYPYGSTAYRAKHLESHQKERQYCYTGMERDCESGLNYHSCRYYIHHLGRWCSVDPCGLLSGLNVFLYSRNSPEVFTDPSGMDPPPAATMQLRLPIHRTAPSLVEYRRAWAEIRAGGGLNPPDPTSRHRELVEPSAPRSTPPQGDSPARRIDIATLIAGEGPGSGAGAAAIGAMLFNFLMLGETPTASDLAALALSSAGPRAPGIPPAATLSRDVRVTGRGTGASHHWRGDSVVGVRDERTTGRSRPRGGALSTTEPDVADISIIRWRSTARSSDRGVSDADRERAREIAARHRHLGPVDVGHSPGTPHVFTRDGDTIWLMAEPRGPNRSGGSHLRREAPRMRQLRDARPDLEIHVRPPRRRRRREE